MSLKDDIKRIAFEIKNDVIQKRRYLHQNPELSFHEFKTSAFIKESLDEVGVPWTPIANTGVLAVIKGDLTSDKAIALRADMDALPIHEETEIGYKSKHEGVMHACGHDVHMASLLGVAQILSDLKSKWGGTVKLIFQPAEEILPGGAIKVIEEGALHDPNVDVVIGQHVFPLIPKGKIGIRKGPIMASMDEIRIEIVGKGGHGAEPHKNIDPVVVASTVILALQQITSRANNPNTPTVLSFGKVQANGAINIIPDKVFIEGTFRTVDEKWRDEAHKKIKKITESIVSGFDCSCNVDIRKGFPFLCNDDVLTDIVQTVISDYAGANSIIETDVWMASEDFAYYSQEKDSCFYFLGVGEKHSPSFTLHASSFNIDENVLELSSGLMAYLAIKVLDALSDVASVL